MLWYKKNGTSTFTVDRSYVSSEPQTPITVDPGDKYGNS